MTNKGVINDRRIRELFTEERVQRAAQAVRAYANRDVLAVLLGGWALVLGMVFTLLVTIRLALTLPLH